MEGQTDIICLPIGSKAMVKLHLKCIYIKKSTAALIRNAKNRLKVHLFALFSLDIFDMRVEKAAVIFEKKFNLMFLLSFSVIRRNFGIFLGFFNGGVLLLVEWT